MGFNPRRRLAYQRWTFFGFTGEMRDPNGLNYHRARYYDPGIGIWTALDPFEGVMDQPMSLNGYGYVHGNPVTNVDPSGMFIQALVGACIANPAACAATVAVGVGVAVGAAMAVQQFGKDIACSLHPDADFCQGDTTVNELACRAIEELLQEAINPPKPYSVEDVIKQTFPHLYYPIKGAVEMAEAVVSKSSAQTDTDTDSDKPGRKLYRGTSRYAEILSWNDTGGLATGCGLIFSDAAREIINQGGSIEDAKQHSINNYDSHLRQIGSLDEYVQEHARWGGPEFTKKYGGSRALISLTSFKERAIYFAGSGVVLEVNFEIAISAGAIPQTLPTSNEGEWLVPHMIRMCRASV